MAIFSDVGDIIGYADETGHSKARDQRFNGIAGLIAPATHWEHLEPRWKAVLDEFKIECFHFKDFAAFQGEFRGWSNAKREKLLTKLLNKIAAINALPVGSILCMDDFREAAARHQRYYAGLPDPYHLAFGGILGFVAGFLERYGHKSQKAAIIFSEQAEFKHEAMRYYDEICALEPVLKRRIKPPAFDDMRDCVALQAADLVAYEMYKEFERRRGFRIADKPRHGFRELLKINERMGFDEPFFMFQDKAMIDDSVNTSVARQRRRDYWKNHRRKRA
jgi:hypothetical protein